LLHGAAFLVFVAVADINARADEVRFIVNANECVGCLANSFLPATRSRQMFAEKAGFGDSQSIGSGPHSVRAPVFAQPTHRQIEQSSQFDDAYSPSGWLAMIR
jgi:hypothetical protein